jgi:putative ABC transport system ATP-binding protein
MSEPAPVELRGVSRVYNAEKPEIAVRAVDDVSFRLERGQSVSIIGPSGCGKSTLLNVLGCLDRATSGVYELEGRDVADRSESELAVLRNRHIGFVFQTFNLLPRMTAVENVELPLLYAGVPNSAKVAAEALAHVGMAHRSRHMPNEMSGGEKQRVAIARAIVNHPSILLCDEPTGALDSHTGQEVIELLQEFNAKGTTLIMVTHDLALARMMDRALQMRDGAILMDGAAAQVVDDFIANMSAE